MFDLLEELDFAGHPLLGAACVMHELHGGEAPESWSFVLGVKTVRVDTERRGGGFVAVLDQGRPEFLGEVGADRAAEFARALNLDPNDLDPGLPLEVVSTGLRYLILPVRRGLERARIVARDFAALLAGVGAQFAYVLDAAAFEGRHWNNDGLVEDVATGSAAGTVGAYLLRHSRTEAGLEFVLHQGRFLERPSRIRVRAEGRPDSVETVLVGGDVSMVGRGRLDAPPEPALLPVAAGRGAGGAGGVG